MASIEVFFGLEPGSDRAAEWDQFVKLNPSSGFMQSSHWAAFKKKQGLDCVHIVVRENGTIIGGTACYTARAKKGASLLIAPEGPVLPLYNEAASEEILELILDQCEKLSAELGVMAIRIEPRLPAPAPAWLSQFVRAPSDLIPKETLYLDIAGAEDQVLAGMKPKGRYNIGLSRRRGVEVKEHSDVGAVRKFYRVMVQASKRDGFALEPLQHFEQLLEMLAPHQARVFFAEHEGDTLGTLLLITFGKRATYLYGGISNEKRNLMAGYALQWRAIQIARESGCEVYDFYGYDQFRAPGHPYALFSQFKSKFGGQPMRFVGGHDHFFLDTLADTIVSVLKEVAS